MAAVHDGSHAGGGGPASELVLVALHASSATSPAHAEKRANVRAPAATVFPVDEAYY
jgi:hypothetical protein